MGSWYEKIIKYILLGYLTIYYVGDPQIDHHSVRGGRHLR